MTSELLSVFAELRGQLPEAGEGSRFHGVRLSGGGSHRLGISPRGEPALLVHAVAAPGARRPPPMELEHLWVEYNAVCKLVTDGAELTETLTVVLLRNGD
jgi:hypothetical protein